MVVANGSWVRSGRMSGWLARLGRVLEGQDDAVARRGRKRKSQGKRRPLLRRLVIWGVVRRSSGSMVAVGDQGFPAFNLASRCGCGMRQVCPCPWTSALLGWVWVQGDPFGGGGGAAIQRTQ